MTPTSSSNVVNKKEEDTTSDMPIKKKNKSGAPSKFQIKYFLEAGAALTTPSEMNQIKKIVSIISLTTETLSCFRFVCTPGGVQDEGLFLCVLCRLTGMQQCVNHGRAP